jgi:prepilin-type processing-associated H-X9-DG protein
MNNLKQVGLSFRTWALDNSDKYPMQVAVTNGGTMELVSSGLVFPHFLVMSNELSTPKILICPEGPRGWSNSASTFSGVRPPDPFNVPFTNDNQVSYFVGVDADPSQPSMVLVGDEDIGIGGVQLRHGLQHVWTNSAVSWIKPRHSGGGNVGLADGSVQQVSSAGLRGLLVQTGVATNRLAVP